MIHSIFKTVFTFLTPLILIATTSSCSEIKSEPIIVNSARIDSLKHFFQTFSDTLQNQIDELERYRFEVKFKEAVNHYVDYCMTNCIEIRACDYDSSVYYEDDNLMLLADPNEELIKLFYFDSGRFEDVRFSTMNAPF